MKFRNIAFIILIILLLVSLVFATDLKIADVSAKDITIKFTELIKEKMSTDNVKDVKNDIKTMTGIKECGANMVCSTAVVDGKKWKVFQAREEYNKVMVK